MSSWREFIYIFCAIMWFLLGIVLLIPDIQVDLRIIVAGMCFVIASYLVRCAEEEL